MMRKVRTLVPGRSAASKLITVTVTACFALAVAACSSSASVRKGHAKAASGGMANAKAVVREFSQPTAFPVNIPLLKKPKRPFGYLDCSAPTCGVLIPLFDAAAKAMGVPKPIIAQAGGSASDEQSALASLLAKKPSALLLPAVNLGDLGNMISQYKRAGIPISAAGIMAGPAQGIGASAGGPNNFKRIGKILADWTIVKVGKRANVAWYYTPELDFSAVLTAAFESELKRNCPTCTVRSVPIPLAQDGSTAPATIVSDLKAHPSSNAAIFGNLETAIGLPAALKVAGIHIPIAGGSPLPQSLQDMKNGYIDAAVAFDFGGLAYTEMDAAARLATHEPLTVSERQGFLQDQLITKANLGGGHANAGGYSPTLGYAKIFAKYWKHAKSVA